MNKSIDFTKYLAPNFNPKLKNIDGNRIGCCSGKEINWISCASASLELISGIPAYKIDNFVKNPEEGFYAADMIRFLKKHGFTAIELNSDLITRPHNKPNWRRYFPLQPAHVLLMNINLDLDDNSWVILHNYKILHHNHLQCDVRENPYFFLNKNIQDTILVHHKSWS